MRWLPGRQSQQPVVGIPASGMQCMFCCGHCTSRPLGRLRCMCCRCLVCSRLCGPLLHHLGHSPLFPLLLCRCCAAVGPLWSSFAYARPLPFSSECSRARPGLPAVLAMSFVVTAIRPASLHAPM